MMKRQRAFIAGGTDYTGMPMDDILSHLKDWRDNTVQTMQKLSELKTSALRHRDRLDSPGNIIEFLDFFIDRFDRYAGDFSRLVGELPHGVAEAHIEIVRQIYMSSEHEDDFCVRFKNDQIERSLKDERMRGLVDEIYGQSRDMVIDYRDLSNLVPRLRTFLGTTRIAVDVSVADRKFALMAIEEARKSVAEDSRPHPRVGVVVVKDGKVLSKAHRGENPKSHAEYIAMEVKLPDDVVAGATVYTTLEPCTTRNHPKIPCAQRLLDRKVSRVVIGMLDPNPDIRGRGDQVLSDAGIETQLFPRDLRAQVEEINRDFVNAQRRRQNLGD